MLKTNETYKLNNNQLHILMLIYKFRFITIPLLTTYQNLNQETTILRTLRILENNGYIHRKFEPIYKIDRKPAIYWLTAKGVAVFKDDPRFNPSILHSYYKNKSLSDEFIQHNINTFKVYNSIRNSYKAKFEMFTKQEIAHFTDFPETKPDIYLRGDKEYFIVLAHDMQSFLLKKRLSEYITHSEEEGWGSVNYPSLLFVLNSSNSESRFLDLAKSALDSAGIAIGELPIATTTLRAINQSVQTSEIWTFVGENTVPISLD